jgi:diaminopimelate decarboxylase
VLAVRVDDVKRRDDSVYAICDGGRTNHALISEWEPAHTIEVVPQRSGPTTLTTVCGPSCMAFDRLGRFHLPPVEVGDLLVWRDAGAYHIPWETRFSRGRCPVVWCDEDWRLHVARDRETPQAWWSEWTRKPTS